MSRYTDHSSRSLKFDCTPWDDSPMRSERTLTKGTPSNASLTHSYRLPDHQSNSTRMARSSTHKFQQVPHTASMSTRAHVYDAKGRNESFNTDFIMETPTANDDELQHLENVLRTHLQSHSSPLKVSSPSKIAENCSGLPKSPEHSSLPTGFDARPYTASSAPVRTPSRPRTPAKKQTNQGSILPMAERPPSHTGVSGNVSLPRLKSQSHTYNSNQSSVSFMHVDKLSAEHHESQSISSGLYDCSLLDNPKLRMYMPYSPNTAIYAICNDLAKRIEFMPASAGITSVVRLSKEANKARKILRHLGRDIYNLSMPTPEEARYPSQSCKIWAHHIFELLDKVVTFRPTCCITNKLIPAEEIGFWPEYGELHIAFTQLINQCVTRRSDRNLLFPIPEWPASNCLFHLEAFEVAAVSFRDQMERSIQKLYDILTIRYKSQSPSSTQLTGKPAHVDLPQGDLCDQVKPSEPVVSLTTPKKTREASVSSRALSGRSSKRIPIRSFGNPDRFTPHAVITESDNKHMPIVIPGIDIIARTVKTVGHTQLPLEANTIRKSKSNEQPVESQSISTCSHTLSTVTTSPRTPGRPLEVTGHSEKLKNCIMNESPVHTPETTIVLASNSCTQTTKPSPSTPFEPNKILHDYTDCPHHLPATSVYNISVPSVSMKKGEKWVQEPNEHKDEPDHPESIVKTKRSSSPLHDSSPQQFYAQSTREQPLSPQIR